MERIKKYIKTFKNMYNFVSKQNYQDGHFFQQKILLYKTMGIKRFAGKDKYTEIKFRN